MSTAGRGQAASHTRSRLPLVPLIAIALQIALLASGLALGSSPWLSIAAAAAVIVVPMARVSGYRLAAAGAAIIALLAVLLTLTATAATGLPMAPSLTVVATVIGIAAATQLPARLPVRAPAWRELAPLAGALSGAALITGAYVVSLGQSRNLRLDWVMRNDSANNLTFARIIVDRGGIPVGGGENPAPLPAALVAVSAISGRSSTPPTEMLVHDLSAMAVTWIALIAATCILAGIAASTIAVHARAPWWAVTAAAAAGSLMVLSWLFTGYPMQFGFLNTHVALVIILSAIVAFFESGRSPALGLTLLSGAGILILGAWSPLVVLPAGLFITLALTRWRVLQQAGRRALVTLGTAFAALLAYAGVISLPVLLEQREALGGVGGIYNPGNHVVFVVGVVVVALAYAAFRSFRALEFLGVCAMVLSCWAGIGGLLFLSRHAVDPWTYYPIKFAWMSLLIFLVVGAGLAVAALVRSRTRLPLRIAGFAVLAAVLIRIVVVVTPWGAEGDSQHPLEFVAVGNEASGYPTLSGYVLDLAGDESPAVLWRSGFRGEGQVNIWVMQVAAGSLDSELRLLPFTSYGDPTPEYLCQAQELMGPGLVVHTEDPDLEGELLAVCPSSTATFVVEAPRGDGD